MTVKAFLFLRMAKVCCANTNEHRRSWPHTHICYVHTQNYIQENVNTVYKETESEKSNWNRNSWDETVTLTHLFIREDRNIECKSPHLSILQVHLCVVHSYRGKNSLRVREREELAVSGTESMHGRLSLWLSLTPTHLRHIHINLQYIAVIKLHLSFITTTWFYPQ